MDKDFYLTLGAEINPDKTRYLKDGKFTLRIPKGFNNAVYLGTYPDFDGNTITNHYFAYPVLYNGERQIVFCRARENADRAALYIHDIFVEKDIKNEALVLPPDITASKAEIAHGVFKGSELMSKVLQLVYSVNPNSLSKVVDENGEPKVVCHEINLTERQWLQVRTPSFKKWFGDWEHWKFKSGLRASL